MKLPSLHRPPLLMLVLLALSTSARAHHGPPIPIISQQKIGPCIVSVWSHPNIGMGVFIVRVDPVPGGTVPDDLKVQIGVQPVSGRLPEVVYDLQRDNLRGQTQYEGEAGFDAQEFWRVRIILRSSWGSGEAIAKVEATPGGFGRWDLLLYLLPFLAIGFLWVRALLRRRRYKRREADQSMPQRLVR